MQKQINQQQALESIVDITKGLLAFNQTYRVIHEIAAGALSTKEAEPADTYIRYFKIINHSVPYPHSVLIKAYEAEQAKDLYLQVFPNARNLFETSELSRDTALIIHSFMASRDADALHIDTIMHQFQRNQCEILVISGPIKT